ncbi:MAG TPA: hypothetical protein VF173_24925 [Thermoanaerobaculia bacterium]|nr:hypothetical protein [Thermoanaerobaculia bacterium]
MATAKNEATLATVGRFFQAPSTHFFLFGPRGTGKSTWLRGAYPDALWVDLLQPEVHRQLAAFREDYPKAALRLLYRGKDSLEIDGVPCLPCDAFLRRLVPGQPLP